ncbi:MAG: S8 family serine peptidase [Candidatus Kerfeldbacteria bacterium]|nr:S8 family serine peptidase [Candidatus Kerfeldbacteria bacterium]
MRYWIGSAVVAMSWAVATVVSAADYVPNEVLVKWADQPTTAADVSVVRVSDVTTAIDLFQADPRVEYVEPNYRRFIQTTPNDTYYTSGALSYLEQTSDADIDAAKAWNYSTGSRTVIVAVLDTGVDTDHIDLADNIWVNPGEVAANGIDDDGNGYIDDVSGWDFIDNDNDPSPQPTSANFNNTVVLHGTHVSGTIGAVGNNVEGVTGVNWEVSIMPIKIFDDDGDSSVAALADAIAYAIANGADILNMSFGGYDNSKTERAAIAEAVAAGQLVVAAAGNDSIDLNILPSYPVCYDNVLGVGATDASDAMASFSNYGTDCVDIGAPGQSILSTYYTGDAANGFTADYGFLSGTSMSTPVVSGVAALLLSVDDTLDLGDLATAIIDTADDVQIPEFGAGRVNAGSAIAAQLDLTVSAFHSASRKNRMQTNQRERDTSPYFSWAKPFSPAAISGYYVYFGTQRLDPLVYGTFQTKRSFTPSAKVHGNERKYRLRVKAIDTNDDPSPLGEFIYIVDTKVRRPTWNSIEKLVDSSVQLHWYRTKGEHVVGYKVYRANKLHGKYKSISGVITQKKYTDSTTMSGQRYYYKVRAIDNLGNISAMSHSKAIKL